METNGVKSEINSIKRKVQADLRRKVGMNRKRKEGPVARAIESQTARIPSDMFLWTSVGAMAASLTLQVLGKKHTSLFIAHWVAPFLLFGIYNKLVKTHGHDRESRTA